MSESSTSVIKVIRCIVCPTGCEIQAKKDPKGKIVFEGYTCNRGLEYANQEFYEPKRILTTTIRVENGLLPLIPVRTDKPILKEKLRQHPNVLSVTASNMLPQNILIRFLNNPE